MIIVCTTQTVKHCIESFYCARLVAFFRSINILHFLSRLAVATLDLFTYAEKKQERKKRLRILNVHNYTLYSLVFHALDAHFEIANTAGTKNKSIFCEILKVPLKFCDFHLVGILQ